MTRKSDRKVKSACVDAFFTLAERSSWPNGRILGFRIKSIRTTTPIRKREARDSDNGFSGGEDAAARFHLAFLEILGKKTPPRGSTSRFRKFLVCFENK